MELNDGLSISMIQSGARAKHLDNQDSTLCYDVMLKHNFHFFQLPLVYM